MSTENFNLLTLGLLAFGLFAGAMSMLAKSPSSAGRFLLWGRLPAATPLWSWTWLFGITVLFVFFCGVFAFDSVTNAHEASWFFFGYVLVGAWLLGRLAIATLQLLRVLFWHWFDVHITDH